jgi:hypothetical protein
MDNKEIFEAAIMEYFNSLLDINIDVKDAQMTILLDVNNILFNLEAARYKADSYDKPGTCYKCQKYSENKDFYNDQDLYKITYTGKIICERCYNKL